MSVAAIESLRVPGTGFAVVRVLAACEGKLVKELSKK